MKRKALELPELDDKLVTSDLESSGQTSMATLDHVENHQEKCTMHWQRLLHTHSMPCND